MNYSLCLILFDIDRFKYYNDKFGHLAGDDVLKIIGQVVSTSIRKNVDSAFRYGGDEFAILLPNADEDDAISVSDRIKNKLSKKIKNITISVGIAFLQEGFQIKDFINAADMAMYANKEYRQTH